MIEVHQISTQGQMTEAFEIRRKVFVIEQSVDPAEEYDEFEESCTHLLAMADGVPCGTARIRKTDKGIKLERFAVLKPYRGKGVGKALVLACIDRLPAQTYTYLHAQEHAIPFYAGLGFEITGDRFWECEIPHFTMYLRGTKA